MTIINRRTSKGQHLEISITAGMVIVNVDGRYYTEDNQTPRPLPEHSQVRGKTHFLGRRGWPQVLLTEHEAAIVGAAMLQAV